MTDRDVLVARVRALILAQAAVSEALDRVLPPMPTGYLRAEQSWTIAYANIDGPTIEIGIDFPEGDHVRNWTTADQLTKLQATLGATHVSAGPFGEDRHGHPRTRYVVQWSAS